MFRHGLIAGLSLALAGCALGDAPPNAPAVPGAVAVVELFTSEGCSSCPPADVLLASIADDAHANHRPVIAMEWHVDYWNRLGWVDPFSTAEATARQQKYAEAFKAQEVYTPQMIVNGREQFVGSDKTEASRAIANALSKPASVRVTISNANLQNDLFTADFSTDQTPDGALLQVMAVQRSATTNVARGENGGRMLHHRNVVRASQTLKAPSSGKINLKLPSDVAQRDVRSDVSVIAFVQDPKTMTILGAAEATILP